MATNTNITSRRPRRWLRWIGFIFGGLLVLLVAAYLVGTSGWFLKSVILPKASQSLNARITVDDADISPFSAVTLRGLRVQTTGSEPLVTAQEVRARYKLMDILKGNINVEEVALQSPVVNLVTFADGTSNLDTLTKSKEQKAKTKEPPKEKKEEKPPQLDLKKFALNNATVRHVTEHKDGTRQVIELKGVNITADNLANNKTAKLALSADMRFDQGLKSTTNGVLAAKVNGKFDVAFDAALKPVSVAGQAQIDTTEAKGAFEQAAGLGIVLNTDLTPTELKDASIRFTQRGNALGALAVSGPFNAETMEAKLAIRISQIDRQLLNVAGATLGIDFNQTSINSSNTVELTQKGRVLTVNGQLALTLFSVTQRGQTTPPLDMRSTYAVTYDQTNKTALIQAFALNGTQQNAEFLRGTLTKPMLLDLSKGTNAVDESAFDLAVTNLNLADWRAFAGTNVNLASGKLGLTLGIVSRQAGQNLTLNLATRIVGLTAAAGGNRIDNADIGLSARGTIQDFSRVKLEEYRADLARGGQSALTASGALQYDTKSQDADVQANLDVSLPQVASLVTVPGLSVNSGTVKFAGRVGQKNSATEASARRVNTPQSGTASAPLDRTVVGKLNLENFTGAFGSNRFDRFEAAVDLDVAMRGAVVDIRKLTGALKQSGAAGGTFDMAGNYHLTNKAGQITAKLADLNQNALKSFVASALGEKQLASVTINANTTMKLEPNGASDVKAELHVANLVVNDPEGKLPKTPLAVDAMLDAVMAKQVLDLRRAQIGLTKTERAANQLNIAGRIDMSKSNAYTGNLKITSDGLDVTPYYDLFAGNKPTNATSHMPAQPAPVEAPKPQTEPAPVQLPFAQFTGELNVAKFYLREIEILNLVSKTVIDNGRVTVNPFSLSLNGAPVSLQAMANLAVAGYEYDLKFNGNRIPVEPLANTFAPDKRGQFNGVVLASAQIKGAGVTGPNLKKNLQGQLGLTLTNAAVQITLNKWVQRILVPISYALRLPDIAKSPLTLVDAQASVRDGTINIAGTTVESSAFKAGVSGTVTMANIMTNSTLNHLPVQLALKHTAKAGATNAELMTLPSFVSIAGTVGKPEPKIDSVAVGRILASTVGNIVGGDAGKLLQGLGNLGVGGTNQTGTGTNSGSTNVLGNLIQGVGSIFQRPKTNTATGTNAPPKKFNLNDLLK